MSRSSRRALPAAVAGLLLAAGAVAVTGPSAQAGPTAAPSVGAFAATGGALIHGLVQDQTGRPVDAVEVEVVDADGVTVATDFSYASDREDGPQHGYYYAYVWRGTYEVTYSKPGYRTVTQEVTRTRRQRSAIEPVTIERKKVATTTTADAPGKVRQGTRVELRVEVSARGEKRPTGTVVLFAGSRRIDSEALRPSDRGELEFSLGRLPRGTHTYRAEYAGTPYLKASESGKVVVKVERSRRR